MKHLINPQVDCVFKAILGSEKNKPVLKSFLNSIIEPSVPITQVELLNPYNERQFQTDKLSIVDVKAKDAQLRTYQIEIQMAVYPHLPARILYNWSDLYASQLKSGEDYHELQPVIAIWLLAENLFKHQTIAHHHFQVTDNNKQMLLNEHCSIHLLELQKWQEPPIITRKDEWALFFRNAQHWHELPAMLTLPELTQAMATLKRFSEKERNYHLYQARQNAIREQKSRQRTHEEAIAERGAALEELEATKAELDQTKTKACKEQERLKALLLKAGINPD